MSADAFTPERIAKFEDEMRTFGRLSASHCRELLGALTAYRDEVQRLTEESRRSDAGRVEVPDSFTVGAVYAAVNRGCGAGISNLGCCGDRDMMRKPILCPSCRTIHGRMADALASRLSPSPQPATGAVVIRDPDDDDWDAFGFQQGTKAEVLRVWNRALATCKDSLQVPQPSADVVVVPRELLERLHDFVADSPNMVAGMQLQAEISDALRSSTNHDAQDAAQPTTNDETRG